jgi:addiction module RelE/StbE family toxin
MKIQFQKSFSAKFTKLSGYQKRLVKDTLEIFAEDSMNKDLRNHPLKEKWLGYRSITAAVDLRLHCRAIDKGTALFVAVGNHDELYK